LEIRSFEYQFFGGAQDDKQWVQGFGRFRSAEFLVGASCIGLPTTLFSKDKHGKKGKLRVEKGPS